MNRRLMCYDIAAEQVSQQGRNGHDVAESSSTVFVFMLLSMSKRKWSASFRIRHCLYLRPRLAEGLLYYCSQGHALSQSRNMSMKSKIYTPYSSRVTKIALAFIRRQAQPANNCPSVIFFEDTPESVMLLFNPFLKGCEIASQW